MTEHVRRQIVSILQSMKFEADDIAREYSNVSGDKSPEALYNVLASISSKQGAMCEILQVVIVEMKSNES